MYLAKALIRQQLERDTRSAIILTSSLGAHFAIPTVQGYCWTKAAVSNFFTALSYEVSDKIDVLVWEPAVTRTKISEENKKASTTPETAVKGVLRDIGSRRITSGCFKHDF